MKRRVRTIRAIQPNAGVQSWYQRELDALLSAMRTDLTAMVQESASVALAEDWEFVRNRGIIYAPSSLVHLAYDADGQATQSRANTEKWVIAWDASSPNIRLNRALQRWSDKWLKKWDKAANRIAKLFVSKNFAAAQTSFRAALSDASFTVRFAPTQKSLSAFSAAVSENVALIKSIPQQYHAKVQGDVWRAVTCGSDLSTLSTTLQRTYQLTTKRAALIARDQNAKAKATIENTRRQELGITQAIWQHSSAGKEPRPSHVAMNGKIFELRQGMFDPDEGEWILPGQLINCRCTSRAVLPELSEV